MVQLGEKPESLDCSQLTRKFGLVTLVGIPESLDWSHLAGSQKVWTSPTWRDSRKFGLVLLGWISNRLDWSHLAGSHKVWRKVLDVPILRDLRKSELALHGRILESFFPALPKVIPETLAWPQDFEEFGRVPRMSTDLSWRDSCEFGMAPVSVISENFGLDQFGKILMSVHLNGPLRRLQCLRHFDA